MPSDRAPGHRKFTQGAGPQCPSRRHFLVRPPADLIPPWSVLPQFRSEAPPHSSKVVRSPAGRGEIPSIVTLVCDTRESPTRVGRPGGRTFREAGALTRWWDRHKHLHRETGATPGIVLGVVPIRETPVPMTKRNLERPKGMIEDQLGPFAGEDDPGAA